MSFGPREPGIRLLLCLAAFVAVGCDEGDAELPEALSLPGDDYFPESISATADGALYVGSVATGEIVRFGPGETTAEMLVPAGDRGVAGLLAVESSRTLYGCSVDLESLLGGAPESEVRAYDLDTGALRESYPLATPAFCNDFAVDAAGALYVTDSFTTVYRRAASGGPLEVWANEALLAPSSPTGFGGDGIAIDGSDVYVNVISDGRLVRIPIEASGAAGTGVDIALERLLDGPDGMRLLRPGTLLVVNGTSGELVEVAVAGDAAETTLVAGGFNQPTSVAITADSFWVTEGQIGYLLGLVPGEPSLPFLVRRVAR